MNFRNRYIFLLLSLLFLVFVLYFFSSIVFYLAAAFVLAQMGQPIMSFLLHRLRFDRLRFGSALAAVITIVIFILIVVAFFSLFAPILIEQTQQLAKVDYSNIAQALEQPLNSLENFLKKWGVEPKQNFDYEMVRSLFQNWFNPSRIEVVFSSIFGWAADVILGVFSTLFITFFFLQEQGILLQMILVLVPSTYEASTKNAIEDSLYLLRRYFGGVLLQIVIITLFVTISLSLLGIKNAFLIGIIAALLNVIPYLGPILGASFAIAITLVSYQNLDFYSEMLPMLIKVGGVFAVMQLLDNFILQPFIFSNRVMAHPLEIFIVVLLAAQIGLLIGVGAIVGMVLAIPTYTVLRVIARTFLSEFKIVQKLTNRIEIEEE